MTKTFRLASSIAFVLTALPAAAQDPAIVTAAACAPVATPPLNDVFRIIGTTEPSPRNVSNAGERVVVDAGTSRGLQIGQRYYVRRPMSQFAHAEDTAGWIQIVAASDATAIARVDFACTGVMTGDRLEPYAELVLPPGIGRTDATGELDFSRTARVLYGENGHSTVGGRDFMLVSGGQNDGVAPGARYAIYRDLKTHNVPLVLFGEAIVVSAFPDSSLIRVTMARDAVTVGDTLVTRRGGASAAAAASGGAGGAGGQRPPVAGGEGNVAGAGAGGASTGAPVQSFTFEDIYFDFDRYSLRAEALALLDQAVKALADNPTLRIQIEGHTCNIGTAEYNLALGERRSTAVRDYLVSRGVTASRLSTITYGEERPKYENAREETRRLNRRAALTVNLQR